jgi:hypothetical protein
MTMMTVNITPLPYYHDIAMTIIRAVKFLWKVAVQNSSHWQARDKRGSTRRLWR